MNDVFQFVVKPYSQQAKLYFRSKGTNSKKYGIETLWLYDPNLWNLALNEYKTITLVVTFKAKIKTWVPEKVKWV